MTLLARIVVPQLPPASQSWTEAEIEILRATWRESSHLDIARVLGRTERAIRNKLWRLGLVDTSDHWTDKEIAMLRQLYATNGPIKLKAFSISIGRNKANVCRKARELGLGTSISRPKVLPEERAPKISRRKLSTRTPEELHAIRSHNTKSYIAKYGHPRGYREVRVCPCCGRFYDIEHNVKQICCSTRCAHKMRPAMTVFSNAKHGKRSDLNNQYFRSSYEANYARWLNLLIAKEGKIERWEYEPDTFEFTKIRRGTRMYTPDFKVYFQDGSVEYHEVKGWDYPKGRVARERMAKYYPKVKLLLIDADFFKALRRQHIQSIIENWE